MVPPARSAQRWRHRLVTAKYSPSTLPTAHFPAPVTFRGGSSDAGPTGTSSAIPCILTHPAARNPERGGLKFGNTGQARAVTGGRRRFRLEMRLVPEQL